MESVQQVDEEHQYRNEHHRYDESMSGSGVVSQVRTTPNNDGRTDVSNDHYEHYADDCPRKPVTRFRRLARPESRESDSREENDEVNDQRHLRRSS
jgi:hypothetical protein